MAILYTGQGKTLAIHTSRRESAIASIVVEYGRAEGACYCLIRIPKQTIDGDRIRPRVVLTSADGTLGGKKCSALDFSRRENTVFTMNAGLFNTSTMIPQGQTLIGGSVVTDSPMTDDMGAAISAAECYPLCIDRNGDLSAPYGRSVTAAQLIAGGVVHAVTGWGQLLGNFRQSGTDKFNEIVHPGKYIRQCIGQYDNGDYMVCTVDGSRNGKATNDAGMTYDSLAALLTAKGVKFAYSLDGGGSAQTVIGLRQVNPIYEGASGRAVATLICFDVVDA